MSASDLLYTRPRLQLARACCKVASYYTPSCSSDRGQSTAGMIYRTGLQKWTQRNSRVANSELCTGIETSAGSAIVLFRHLSFNVLPVPQYLSLDGGTLLYEEVHSPEESRDYSNLFNDVLR
jgi:hypothetical protein